MPSKERKAGATVAHPMRPAHAGDTPPKFDPVALDMLEHWITERDAIRAARAAGKPAPWTQDPILQTARFCNVRRMDDKVSQWLLNNWYAPMKHTGARNIVTMATLARHINWPDTLQNVPYIWDAIKARKTLESRKASSGKVFTGVYIINGGGKGVSKISAVVARCDDVWRRWQRNIDEQTSMRDVHAWLCGTNGIASFMAGQVVADLRHTPVLAHAVDAMTWAPRGPGSTRGMNRLLARSPLSRSFKSYDWDMSLNTLYRVLYARRAVRRVFDDRGVELMDLQNCLCENDKYSRFYYGEGRPRNKYPGQEKRI